MNSQDKAAQPPRKTAVRWIMIALIPIVAILATKALRPAEWRPDLHLTNTGKSAVTVLYHDQTFMTQPGETWRKRVRAGDTITVRSGTAADAPSATLTFPARNPKPDNSIAQRWTADVNADDPKNIRFDNRLYAEVTEPPTKPEPWP
jgi:hypothetical protein